MLEWWMVWMQRRMLFWIWTSNDLFWTFLCFIFVLSFRMALPGCFANSHRSSGTVLLDGVTLAFYIRGSWRSGSQWANHVDFLWLVVICLHDQTWSNLRGDQMLKRKYGWKYDWKWSPTAGFHFRPWKSLVLQPTSTTSCQRSQMKTVSWLTVIVTVIVTICNNL